MIKERYCSYEISKLLREKGFDEPCRSIYVDNVDYIDFYYTKEEQTNLQIGVWETLRPTHQMVIDWLRRKHNILISIIPQEVNIGVDRICYAIYKITENIYQPLYNGKVDNLVDSYEEAIEAALKYSLTELI